MNSNLLRLLAAMFWITWVLVSVAHGMDFQVREMQRKLFILGYEVGLPDGAAGPKTRDAIDKFIADHPEISDTSPTGIDAALDIAMDKKKQELLETRPKLTLLVNPKIDVETASVMAGRGRLLAGSCENIVQIDISTSVALGSYSDTCQTLVGYSKAHDGIVTLYSDSIGISDPDVPELDKDFIPLPAQLKGGIPNIAVGNGGRTAVITGYKTPPYSIDLQEPYTARKLSAHKYSVDSIIVSEESDVTAINSSDSKSELRESLIVRAGSGETLLRRSSKVAALAHDGTNAALLSSDNRELVIFNLVTKTDDAIYRLDGDKSGWVFSKVGFIDSSEIIASIDDTNGAANIRLVRWKFQVNAFDDFELDGVPYPHFVQLLPEAGIALTSVQGALTSVELDSWRKVGQARTRPQAWPVDSALNRARNELLVADEWTNSIFALDLTIGAIKKSVTLKADDTQGRHDLAAIEFAGEHTVAIFRHGLLVLLDADLNELGRVRVGTDDDSFDGRGCLTVSSDGKLAAVGYGNIDTDRNKVSVIELPTLNVVSEIKYSDKKTPDHIAFVDRDSRVMVDGYTARVFDLYTGKLTFKKDLQATFADGVRISSFISFISNSLDASYTVFGSYAFTPAAVYKYSNGKILDQKGRDPPGYSWTAGASDIGLVLPDGRLLVENVNINSRFRTIDFGGDKYLTDHGTVDGRVIGLHWLKDSRFVTVDEGGQINFFDATIQPDGTSQFGPYITIHPFTDGNWLARTPSGFFAGTPDAARAINIRTEGDKIIPIDSVFDVLYRADLVAEALAGDPNGKVRDAAAAVNLEAILATGSAPTVSFLAPAADLQTESGIVTAKVEIHDEGGGIGRVEWRVSGTTRSVTNVGRQAKNDGQLTLLEEKLILDGRENTIEVIAYNAADKVASVPTTTNVVWTTFEQNQKPRLFVLSVGVNDYYDSRLRLAFARDDAEAIGKALMVAGQSLFESVNTNILLDDQVTKEGLNNQFRKIAREIRSSDVFVLFVAGHGITQDGRYYYIPQDFRYVDATSIANGGIKQEDWQEWLASVPANKSLLLFDTCESGSLTGDPVTRSGLDRLSAIDRLTRATGRSVLSAATDTGPALEGYKGHGVFAYSLLEALGLADGNDNGAIEITEIAGYVDRSVPEISEAAFGLRQIPQMRLIGENFAIGRLSPDVVPTDGGTRIDRKPTHVAIAEAVLYAEPTTASPVSGKLVAGQLVTVVSSAGGFAQVAKDGSMLGYVESKRILILQ
ncbi:caspase family protein [Mesorhizobium sp.]|uniref:caspase family protein n=1 Tax=Mesorhizobium sp. TaxID=1871066 RepID=UPI000FE7B505|nr:caspase family protein [Mesorhizobium sp.]RWD81318.1 MAG: hypothetical protein EOS48_16665 [Mesorhizobium sp.]